MVFLASIDSIYKSCKRISWLGELLLEIILKDFKHCNNVIDEVLSN